MFKTYNSVILMLEHKTQKTLSLMFKHPDYAVKELV